MRQFWKTTWFPWLLLIIDAIFLFLLWIACYYLRVTLNPYFPKVINPVRSYLSAAPLVLALCIIISAYYRLYNFREKTSGFDMVVRILKTSLVSLVGLLALATLVKHLEIGRSVILFSAIGLFLYLYITRTFIRYLKRRLLAKGYGLTRVVIVGAGEAGNKVKDQIINHPESGFKVIGFVDDDPSKINQQINGIPVLGKISELPQIIKSKNIEQVFLAIPSLPSSELINIIMRCESTGVEFRVVSDMFGVLTSSVKIDEVDEVPIVRVPTRGLLPWQALLKRMMDIVVASFLLILFAIPSLIIIVLIKIDSKGPAIFKQQRVGKDGKLFLMYKFRTMYNNVNPYEEAPVTPEDPRITRFGKLLRKTSLDEIPQLLNVLKGDMSMVGPRPEMPFIAERYEEWQKRRLDVKPGITGLWQIAGRKKLPLYLNLEYDFYYIRNQSLLLDITILLKTIYVVLFGKGAF
ncbi:sugar transferase [Candidatus Sumerlaeota bacterium]|nr:sugar transferase [Candidatus Sumerlaeota bacterium]